MIFERPESMELRAIGGRIELREQAGASPMLSGYAAVFNELSVDLGDWREIIMPGAFGPAIGEGADVRALWQHDSSLVLGRTLNGTLRLAEDEIGLHCEIEPPETGWAADAMRSVRRGDVTQMSFGFEVPAGGDTWRETPEGWLRTIWRVTPLYEVSPVTFPAYPLTSISARNQLASLRVQAASINGGLPAGLGPSRNAASRQRRLALIEGTF